MARTRTKLEVEQELTAQLRLLQKAAHEFDGGDIDEFRNIARALRVLCTESLISFSGQDDCRQFLDTRYVTHPNNIAPIHSLTAGVIGDTTRGVRALLDSADKIRFVPFSSWLSQTIIDDREGVVFDRKRLIKCVAHQDGAMHFPEKLRPFYEKLKTVEYAVVRNGRRINTNATNLEKHTLRQIAHEVLKSFDPTYKRNAQIERGAVIMASLEYILVPGRRSCVRWLVKKQGHGPAYSGPVAGIDELGFPSVSLPYEFTDVASLCPCKSGLTFGECCRTGRDFSREFLANFARTHNLDGI